MDEDIQTTSFVVMVGNQDCDVLCCIDTVAGGWEDAVRDSIQENCCPLFDDLLQSVYGVLDNLPCGAHRISVDIERSGAEGDYVYKIVGYVRNETLWSPEITEPLPCCVCGEKTVVTTAVYSCKCCYCESSIQTRASQETAVRMWNNAVSGGRKNA